MKVKHCPACKGHGFVIKRDGIYEYKTDCQNCKGTGRVKATKTKATKP